MLDIIENDLLKKHLPGVSYLRLDGSVPTHLRHEIVKQFNSDPSWDILLLTTQVGTLKKDLYLNKASLVFISRLEALD